MKSVFNLSLLFLMFVCCGAMNVGYGQEGGAKITQESSLIQRSKKAFIVWLTNSYIMPAIAAKGILPAGSKGVQAKIVQQVKDAIVDEIAYEPWLSFSYNFFWDPEASIDAMRGKIVSRIETEITKYVRAKRDASYPHKEDVATVRYDRTVSDKEKAFVRDRITKTVLPTMQKLLDDYTMTIDTMPRINVAISGGGTRATLAALGAVLGLEDMGILPAVQSISTLSGSTWFLTPWVYSDLSLLKLKDKYVKPNLKNGLRYDFYTDSVLVNLAYQQMFSQPYTLVDFYGILLSGEFLRMFQDPFAFRLSQGSIDPSNRPYPILALASPEKEKMKKLYLGYEYYEVTPDEVGSYERGAFIPTWSFGRTFANGVSTNRAIEMPAGKFLAMCGSAFLFSVKDMLVTDDRLSSLWRFYTGHFMPDMITRLTDFRAAPPQLPDFVKGGDKKRVFVDAGLLSNLASGLSFLGRESEGRKTDVLILIDLSAGTMGKEYEKLHSYVTHKSDYFVPIAPPGPALGKELMTISGAYDSDTGSTGPTTIYFPLINNPHVSNFDIERCKKEGAKECETFNFKYAPKTVDQLVNLMKKNVSANGHKSAIIDVLKTIVAQKKKRVQQEKPPIFSKATALDIRKAFKTRGGIKLRFRKKQSKIGSRVRDVA